MSICKDCIHYEICDPYVAPNESFPEVEGGCKCFAPTADVVEVRHGEWTKSSSYNRFMNCSVCGFGQSHTAFKYCPNCGAKMDGEKRSENEKS